MKARKSKVIIRGIIILVSLMLILTGCKKKVNSAGAVFSETAWEEQDEMPMTFEEHQSYQDESLSDPQPANADDEQPAEEPEEEPSEEPDEPNDEPVEPNDEPDEQPSEDEPEEPQE